MAAPSDEIRAFVRAALERGRGRQEIREALLAAGWPPAQIESAIGSYAEIDFPVPVPRPRPTISAREAFLYLTLFAALYIVAYQLGALVFAIIDTLLPDALESSFAIIGTQDAIRWAVASLVIAAPVFLGLTRKLNREIAANPIQGLSSVRLWLTYLTLFLAAVLLIGDMTWVLYSFLSGELTLRFALKLATVAAIAAAIFGYYLRDLAGAERRP